MLPRQTPYAIHPCETFLLRGIVVLITAALLLLPSFLIIAVFLLIAVFLSTPIM